MSRVRLLAKSRDLRGKKVKRLRREGLLPGNVYGPGVESLAVQFRESDFRKILRLAGETELIELQLEEEKEPRLVLISDVQRDPVKQTILHADLYQVDLSQEVEVDIPLEFIHAQKANRQGVVLELRDEIEVLAYPSRIPPKIVVDLSVLQEIGQTITIADLEIPEGVKVREDPQELVAKLSPPEQTLLEEEGPLQEEAVAGTANQGGEEVSESPVEPERDEGED